MTLYAYEVSYQAGLVAGDKWAESQDSANLHNYYEIKRAYNRALENHYNDANPEKPVVNDSQAFIDGFKQSCINTLYSREPI